VTGSFDLVRDMLDHELVDCDGVSCGIVDDIELEESEGKPRVAALLAGPGAWGPRLPALLALAARRAFGTRHVRIPWSEVEHIRETVQLRSRAASLGLGTMERRLGRWLKKLPGAA
jgi:sporulation protein YlmC with PRC-barrel domain